MVVGVCGGDVHDAVDMAKCWLKPVYRRLLLGNREVVLIVAGGGGVGGMAGQALLSIVHIPRQATVVLCVLVTVVMVLVLVLVLVTLPCMLRVRCAGVNTVRLQTLDCHARSSPFGRVLSCMQLDLLFF